MQLRIFFSSWWLVEPADQKKSTASPEFRFSFWPTFLILAYYKLTLLNISTKLASLFRFNVHFSIPGRKTRFHFRLYLNKLTLTVFLRNARTIYFIFRNDYLQPLQEGLKEEKEKKTEAARRKSYPIRPMTSKLRHTDISATSSRRIDVSTTLFWRPTPAGMLLKKSKPNRTWRPINVDATWFTSHRCRYDVILRF